MAAEKYPCPLAEHYADCPRFRKDCDAINCEAKFHWRELVALKAAKEKKR